MSKSTPVGIYVVGILMALGGILNALGGFLGGVLGLLSLGSQGGMGLLLTMISTVLFFLGLGYLITAYGLVTLQSWGWTWTIGLVGLGFALNVVSLVLGDLGAILNLVLNGVVLAYVYSKRDLYKRSRDRTVPRANEI